MTPSAYPLAWPPGWPRTPRSREKHGTFRHKGSPISLMEARNRLDGSLEKIKAAYVVLSSNIPMRLNGKPGTDDLGFPDVGVCCYFQLGNKPISLPCDRYDAVADNIAAIAAHIEATRAIERHGVGSLEKMFAGFMALPAPEPAPPPWWHVLGLKEATNDLGYAEYAYRNIMKDAHPDAGGSQKKAAEINAAIAEARKILK